jgi:Bifunctional DNA primase/polymerase, N-terminal
MTTTSAPALSPLGLAALAYAQRGWPVFPLAPDKKSPLIAKKDGGRGFHDATRDEAQIIAWWSKAPRANIGMPTGEVSGIVVIDVDPRNGGDARFLKLPLTLTARTPSGGYHHYLSVPKGVRIPKDNTGKLGPGIDFLGDGAYVVLPPSELSEEAGYGWD